jgi:5-methylcytosine-specific restriction endonuclease McrA
MMEKEGRVRKGDGREVDHKVPLSRGGSNSRRNLRVVSRRTNRKKGAKR